MRDLILNKSKSCESNGGKISIVENLGNYISFVSSSSEKTSDFSFPEGKIEISLFLFLEKNLLTGTSVLFQCNIVSFLYIIYISRDLILNKSKSNGGKISIVEDLGNYISFVSSSSSSFSEETSDFFSPKGK